MAQTHCVPTSHESPLVAEKQPGVSKEIAALHQRIAELEAAVRARDEFICTVGHELRNPLSPLFLQAELLLAKARNAPEGMVESACVVPRLEAFSQRLQRFVLTLDRILDVSRISTGRIDLALETVDLATVMRDAVGILDCELTAAGSALTLDIESVCGLWDPMRLEQICLNLLSNAIRYGLGRPITVTLRAQGSDAVLTVEDQGMGITVSEQETIFERFDRGIGRRQSGGFGVGLWVVNKVSDALGGNVAVESRPGEGARFTVYLPTDGMATP